MWNSDVPSLVKTERKWKPSRVEQKQNKILLRLEQSRAHKVLEWLISELASPKRSKNREVHEKFGPQTKTTWREKNNVEIEYIHSMERL